MAPAQKVRDELEKTVMRYSNETKELINDFVMLYSNKVELGVTRQQLLKILDAVKLGADQAFQTQMQPLTTQIDRIINTYETEMVAALTVTRPKALEPGADSKEVA